MKYKFITIEGNISAGKTTLARMLSNEFNARLILEEFAHNPFLPHFYKERKRYAFTTEVYFMLDRLEQLKKNFQSSSTTQNKETTISDYLFRKTLLFAKMNLEEIEYQLFERLFNELYADVYQPELIIYLHASIDRLKKNIKKRGRTYEQNINPHYLEEVESVYLQYFRNNPQLKVLFLHINDMDYVHNPVDYQRVLEWISKDYPAGIHEINGQVLHNS